MMRRAAAKGLGQHAARRGMSTGLVKPVYSSTVASLARFETTTSPALMSHLACQTATVSTTCSSMSSLTRGDLPASMSDRRFVQTSATSATTSTTSSSPSSSSSSFGPIKHVRSVPKWDLPTKLKVGNVLHGFRVVEACPHPALNLTLYRLVHERSQAVYVHIDRDDFDNAFCVGFRTIPRDDSGIAHILEHTALCGSEKYPVRDPFFMLVRRSLNTFMNAMTRPECTFYPFSSQNEKDFQNLLGVYLDAAFFPLLKEPDFRQEGHRLEVVRKNNNNADAVASSSSAAAATSPTAAAAESVSPDDVDLVFKGVVFNEMKGALSEPPQHFISELEKHLFPSAIFRNNSGGDPLSIPSLTHEGLLAFHRLHYHPSNAVFFTYGDMNPPLEQVNDVINKRLDRLAADPSLSSAYVIPPLPAPVMPEQASLLTDHVTPEPSATVVPYPTPDEFISLLGERNRYSAPRTVTATGPENPMLAEDKQSKFTLAWLARETITDLTSPTLLSKKFIASHTNASPAVRREADSTSPEASFSSFASTSSSVDRFLKEPVPIGFHFDTMVPESIIISAITTPSTSTTVDYEEEAERALARLAHMTPEQRAEMDTAMEEVALSLLSTALFDNPSPIYDILYDPELGLGPAPMTCGVKTSTYDNLVTLGMYGCAADRISMIADKLLNALVDAATSGAGLDVSRMHGYLHQIELAVKTVSPRFGVNLAMNLVPMFVNGRDMNARLDITSDALALLKRSIDTHGMVYFRALIAHHLLENPHRLLFIMHADKEHNKKLMQKETDMLRKRHSTLTSAEIARLEKEAQELKARQEAPKDPSCLPSLSLDDVGKVAPGYEIRYSKEKVPILPPAEAATHVGVTAGRDSFASLAPSVSAATVATSPAAEATDSTTPTTTTTTPERVVGWAQEPTNGIVSLRASVDDILDRCDATDLPALVLIASLYSQLGVNGRSFEDHSALIDGHTGGLAMSLAAEVSVQDLTEAYLRIYLRGQALSRNAHKLAELLAETAVNQDFRRRLYDRIVQLKGGLAADLLDSPQRYAAMDASARLPNLPEKVLVNALAGVPIVQVMGKLADKLAADIAAVKTAKGGADADVDSSAAAAAAAVDAAAVDAAEEVEGEVEGDEKGDDVVAASASLAALSQRLADVTTKVFGQSSPSPSSSSSSSASSSSDAANCGVHRVLAHFDEASIAQARKAVPILLSASGAPAPVAYPAVDPADAAAVESYLATVKKNSGNSSNSSKANDVTAALTGSGVTVKAVTESHGSSAATIAAEKEEQIKMESKIFEDAFGVPLRKGETIRNWLDQVVKKRSSEAAATTASAASTSSSSSSSSLQERPYCYLAMALQVNHCQMTFRAVPTDHPDAGALMVLASLMTDGFLHGAVREKGGAYGGGASFNDGVFRLSSFRDPRVEGTLADFVSAVEWVKQGLFTEREFTETKLGVLGVLDTPVVPTRRGVGTFFHHYTQEQRQRLRDQVFAAQPGQMKELAEKYLRLSDGMERVTVAGGQDNIPEAIVKDAANPNGKWKIVRLSV